MLFDIKAGDKGKGTCSARRAETLPIQQLGDNNENKTRWGNTRGKKEVVNRPHFKSPPAAKPTLLQQLQNMRRMLCQWPLMSSFSGLLIFHWFNTMSKLHKTSGKWGVAHTRASYTFSEIFLLLPFGKQEAASVTGSYHFSKSRFSNISVFRKKSGEPDMVCVGNPLFLNLDFLPVNAPEIRAQLLNWCKQHLHVQNNDWSL